MTKKYRGWIITFIILALGGAGVWFTLRTTAEYPTVGEAVSYPVNQVDGFELIIDEPSWSPFKGYSIRWEVTADSIYVYNFVHDGEGPNSFEFLEHYVDGQWHRLGYTQNTSSFVTNEFALGGSEHCGLGGSIVQKYAHYGTRLVPGTYRLVLEMKAVDGTAHYLAAEFNVD